MKQIYCTWYPRCVSFLPFFFFPSPFSFFLFFAINDYPTVFAFRNEEKKTLHNLRQLQQRFARDWFAEEIGCIWCVRLGIFWPRWVRRKEGERGTEDTELRINVTFRKLFRFAYRCTQSSRDTRGEPLMRVRALWRACRFSTMGQGLINGSGRYRGVLFRVYSIL